MTDTTFQPAAGRPAPPRGDKAVPVADALPRLREALRGHRRCILEAPPGAGKTTRVPLALLAAEREDGWLSGQSILMLEPRRMAARAAARYVAELLGEPVGRTVGYEVRFERRPGSRITILTEGILTRRLQEDPELAGVGCLIFDEFHERSLNADLGLALALDSQQALREDLRILVMSATLESAPLQRLLAAGGSVGPGEACPVIRSEGRAWPVATRYLPPPRSAPARGGGLPFSARHVADAVRRALAEEDGSILVFLPGAGEIRRVRELLEDVPRRGVSLHSLYGDLPRAAQEAAIAPAPGRKVVLATAIAETSLTIEGVEVVIDAGLARSVRFDPGSGMERLATGRVSLAGAEQRRGRAGRLGPGVCYRLWEAGEEAGFRPFRKPEILEADLASLCLELAVWGVKDASALRWLDEPPAEGLERGRALLRALGALDAAGNATARGRAMAGLPLHPRLAHMVLEGRARGLGAAACLMAALAEERDPLRALPGEGGGSGWPGVDARRRLALVGEKEPSASPGPVRASVRRIRDAAARIARRVGIAERDLRLSDAAVEESGLLLALAYPDRVAGRRERGSFHMAGGRGAALAEGDPLADEPLLAIGALSDGPGDARVFAAAPLGREALESLYGQELTREDRVAWDSREACVVARRERRFGALVLEAEPLSPLPEEACRAAVCAGIRGLGLTCLPWTPELETWRQRVAFMRRLEGETLWPDLSDPCLLQTLEVWLEPFLGQVTRRSHFRAIELGAALCALLPWEQQRRLEREAPTHLNVPSGSRIRLNYAPCAGGPPENELPASPVLAVRLQELFGLTATPRVASGRVPVVLHLLSPAGRPLQITSDLAGFWKTSYPAVRAEMRGRYPRHPWPEDPLSAAPTRRAKPRP